MLSEQDDVDHARKYIYIPVHTVLTADDGFNTMRPKLFAFHNSHCHCTAHGRHNQIRVRVYVLYCIYRRVVHDRMLQ